MMERSILLILVTKEVADKYIFSTLIEGIQISPLKNYILEKWEQTNFFGLSRAQEKLSRGRYGVYIDFDEDDICYCDIGLERLTWDSYSLILQLVKEKCEVIICVDPHNLTRQPWIGWTKILLENLCRHNDWT